jgi:hypothetical protein
VQVGRWAPNWVHSSKAEHAAFNRSVMVRFHLDPPITESKPVGALGRFAKPIAPSRVCDSGSLLCAILEDVAGRSPASASKTGDAPTGMCFDYTAFRQTMETRIGVLIGLESRDGAHSRAVQVRLLLPPPSWRVNRPRVGSAWKARRILTGYLWRQQFSAPNRVVLWEAPGLQNLASRVQFLNGPPDYSGVGCWHPSVALNDAHVRSIRTA